MTTLLSVVGCLVVLAICVVATGDSVGPGS